MPRIGYALSSEEWGPRDLVRLAQRAEEAGFAYKDVHAVTAAAEAAGISRRVAHLSPVGNVKG